MNKQNNYKHEITQLRKIQNLFPTQVDLLQRIKRQVIS